MFKIPFFQNIVSIEQLTMWLSEIYNRLSGGNLVKHIVVDIGDWNMVLTPSVTVPYKQFVADIDFKRVLDISVQIFKDDMTESYFASNIDGGLTSVKIDSTTKNVTITRKSSGFFDSTDFDLTSSGDSTFVTRGRVTLCLST